MFITKRHLSRRTVLRGLGASVSLPLLDAMIPAGTALAQTAAAAKPKMGFFYLPHGAVMDRWKPASTGRAFELPQILKPFEPFQAHMTIVSGLRNKAAEGAGVHAVNPGTWLSCNSPFWAKDGRSSQGVSADQIAAQAIGQDTPFAVRGAVHRSEGVEQRRVQSRVRLRIRIDDLVSRAGPAAADGAQSTQALLPTVRGR